MQVQYSPHETPLKNEHNGFVFHSSTKFETVTVAKRNDRARYVSQHQRQIPLMASNQHWRNLSPGQRQNWIDFAEAFPEPTKANPEKFLSGYQLFCKRQQYVFLNGGITEPWMLAPIAPELDAVTFSASLNAVNHCIDVTELYISNFGILPKVGQFVFLRILPYQTKGGKFYPVFEQTAEVKEVYLDGFFVSLSFPKSTKGITFAVFLSFPVSKNSLYQSSKIRYMGCFTVKSFLDLSDTPDSYLDQGGKLVAVNSDEDALEFIDIESVWQSDFGGCSRSDSNSLYALMVGFASPPPIPQYRNLNIFVWDRTHDQVAAYVGSLVCVDGRAFLQLAKTSGNIDHLVSISLFSDSWAKTETPLRILFDTDVSAYILWNLRDPRVATF